MRNYCAMFECGLFLSGSQIVEAFVFSNTYDESGAALSDLINTFGPGFDPYGPLQCFIKMNKSNLGVICNAAGAVWHPFTPDNFKETSLIVYGDTPRDTWDSNDPAFQNLGTESATGYKSTVRSTKAAGKQDFSGVPGLFDALAALPTLAAELTKEGRLREAGQVTYAYQQVIHLNWTISFALDYLHTWGLV